MNSFVHVFLTVLGPIFIVAGSGYLVSRAGLLEDSRALSRVALYILLPALAFSAIAKSDLGTRDFAALVLFAWTVAGIQAGIGWIVARGLAFDRAKQSGFLLAVITVNAGNYGIPLNQFAFGTETLVRATVYYVATLFVTYAGGILVTTEGTGRLGHALMNILKMPVIYSAFLGLIVNKAGVAIPDLLFRPVRLIGAAAVPIMLILLGIELARARVAQEGSALCLVLGMRLMAAPLLAIGIAWLMGLDGLTGKVAIVQSSMPTAVGAALMAVEFNARPSLVSSAVLVTTLGSFFTLTLLLGVLGQ